MIPHRGGLPHSDTSGSTPARGSPKIFAACHVLHRLLAPRHPPDALLLLKTHLAQNTGNQSSVTSRQIRHRTTTTDPVAGSCVHTHTSIPEPHKRIPSPATSDFPVTAHLPESFAAPRDATEPDSQSTKNNKPPVQRSENKRSLWRLSSDD